MKAQTIRWLEALTWVLIFGGLLTVVLGLEVQNTSAVLGWSLIVGGASAVAFGVVLIFIRSKIKEVP